MKLDLTPEQKQQVKERYLQDYPGPGINGLDDITAFHDTVREMGHSPTWPPVDHVDKLTNQYRETGVVDPELQELINASHASDALYWELFPGGLRKAVA
ncbi:hypothetical protein LCGC14_2030180 [marine sediment metagenome]|uniref:Uncharacterized protein n=1 Tax=marine sediment metagenome TaxID=412755 RepID=A0A0F9H8B0_9ZZZZ